MKIDRLMHWCSANGLKTPLQIRQKEGNDGYRYVVLDPNHPEARKRNLINLIDAPLDKVCMTSKTSDGLADRLLFESTLGEDSLFAPYLATLPTLESFQSTLPRFWTEKTWSLLETQDTSTTTTGSSNMMDGGQLKAAVELDEERLKFSCDEWAQAIVDSRSHFVPPNGQEYALTPVLDMINHNPNVPTKMKRVSGNNNNDDDDDDDNHDRILLQIPANAVWGETEPNLLSQVQSLWNTAMNTPKEQEVFTSYGNMPNAELLLSYGFVQTDNPHNTETLAIPVIRQAKPLVIACNADGSLAHETLPPLRLALVNQEERESLFNQKEGDDEQQMQQTPVSSPNGGSGTASQENGSTTSITNRIISSRNEMEVMALVGGTLEEAVYDLKGFIQQLEQQRQLEKAFSDDNLQHRDDDAIFSLLVTYLVERRKTLQACLTCIQQQYPDLFGF